MISSRSNIVLFYGGVFSQWYFAPMFVRGVEYNCAEQYMMSRKAALFDDEASLKKIMATDKPWEQKRLGKKVEGFNRTEWHAIARGVVLRGNRAKFCQWPHLMAELLATRNAIIAEASPTDQIWGIGLSETDARARHPEMWLGTNWLGEVLMQVRKEFQ